MTDSPNSTPAIPNSSDARLYMVFNDLAPVVALPLGGRR